MCIQMVGSGGKEWDRQEFAPAPKLLTISSPIYEDHDFYFNANEGLIELRPEIVTTLGMSRATYSWFSIVGSVLAGMLGGGWLFYLLPGLKRTAKPVEALRRRPDKQKPLRRNGPS
jgi:hypothetical protein